MRENLEYDEEFAEDQEKDWKSVVFGANKCYCIKARDSAETLDEAMLNGTEVKNINIRKS
jgi:cancer susceptibility candidate protein 1